MKGIQYETYRLTRIVQIHSIVSADYLSGAHKPFHTHAHEYAWELCYCIAGNAEVTYGSGQLSLLPGQCLLIAPGVQHKIDLFDSEATAFVVAFTAMDGYLPLLRKQIVNTTGRQQQQFQQILTELRSAFTLTQGQLRIMHFNPNLSSPLGAEQLICCYLEEILIELMRTLVRQQTNCDGDGDLAVAVQNCLADQITAYIRAHLGDDLSVPKIAGRYHYSRNQIGAIYKAATGISLARAVVLERIARAKELLEAQEKSITDISAELGFSSPQYFSKKFSQEVGCTPSQYVAQAVKNAVP